MRRVLIIVGILGVGLAGFFLYAQPRIFDTSVLGVASASELDRPLEETLDGQARFAAELLASPGFHNREIYERYLDEIGANGIEAGLAQVYDRCHDEAHDFGKVLFARTQSVETALAACDNVCTAGCMHGVMMEFLAPEDAVVTPDDHVSLNDLESKLHQLCTPEQLTDEYKLGDCVHGIGHAVMFLSEYDIPTALDACALMDTDALEYYCATGAYMEFLTNGPAVDPADDLFGPCDDQPFPSACFRYRIANIMKPYYESGGTFDALIDACLALEGTAQSGCFHGIGNGHLQFVVGGQISLAQLCSAGDRADQYTCTEGLMERLSRYYPEQIEVQCATVEDWQNALCLTSADHEMYDLEKSFLYYGR